VTPLANGADVIAVMKLDGSTMHINEDLVERVEGGVEGQSALYLIDGGHIIVANEPVVVVERIRTERVGTLHQALYGPEPAWPRVTPLGRVSGP
jgi:uncharacterized protein YlzI (FlbEa/FlbD family)